MKNFNGTDEEYWAERRRLCKEYSINMIRAGCYLNNFFDDFLCGKCECHCVADCGKIKENEQKRKMSNEETTEEENNV